MKTKLSNSRIFNSIIEVLHQLSIIGLVGGFMCMLIIIKTRGFSDFAGTEVYYDKIVLTLFNTLVMYSALALVVTIFLFDAFTERTFLKYPYMILNAVLVLIIAVISYLQIGIPTSNMASIADAGYHMQDMADDYILFSNRAVTNLWLVLALLVVFIFISAYKPFGKKEKETYKYRTIVLAIAGIALLFGIISFAQSEASLRGMRSKEIKDIDASNVADGEYEGVVVYGESEVRVKVVVQNHKIVDIEDPIPTERSITLYARGVFNRIIDKQTPNVDAISGATTTSKAYMEAVENALENSQN